MADYDYWKTALSGNPDESLIQPGVVECGYWRKPERAGHYAAIATWRDPEHGIIASVEGRVQIADAIFIEKVFAWAVKHPVTEEAFNLHKETGRWPDEAPEVKSSRQNYPDDPFEQLMIELETEKSEAEEFLKEPIKTKERADQAAAWADRLSNHAKKAENLRKVEKEPFLEGGRKIDAKWKVAVDGFGSLVKAFKAAVTPFLREEQARIAEEARKAREAQQVTSQSESPKKPMPKAKAGNFGRSMTLREFKTAKIINYDELVQAIKEYPEVKELAQKIANRVVANACVALPGTEIHIEKKAV